MARPKRSKSIRISKSHDRRALDLPRNAEVVAVEIDDPFAREPGEKIVALRSVRNDPLGRLHAHKQLDEAQYRSGRAFQNDWERAERGPQAIDPSRDHVDGAQGRELVTEGQRQAMVRLNRAERSVELTRNSLSYATLVADARGVVTASMIEPGMVVAAGQAAIRVARFAEKEAVVAIPETLLDRAKNGVATASLWSEAGKTYTARLREIAPAADPATRTYLAKFSLPEATDNVSLGMTATLTLSDPATTRVARLPLSALFSDGRDPSLYVVNDKGEVTLKPVKVKAYDSKDVLVTSGVEEGEKVVALGVQKIDPAQKVRVVSALTF